MSLRARAEHEDPGHRYGGGPEERRTEAASTTTAGPIVRQDLGNGGRRRARRRPQSRGKASWSSGAASTAYGSR